VFVFESRRVAESTALNGASSTKSLVDRKSQQQTRVNGRGKEEKKNHHPLAFIIIKTNNHTFGPRLDLSVLATLFAASMFAFCASIPRSLCLELCSCSIIKREKRCDETFVFRSRCDSFRRRKSTTRQRIKARERKRERITKREMIIIRTLMIKNGRPYSSNARDMVRFTPL